MKDMLGRENVIDVERARALLFDVLPHHAPKERLILIEESLGRICAQDVVATEDLPAFPRSTVDGYAVRAAETFGATEGMPAYFGLAKEIFMAEEPDFILPSGKAARIPTGGMLPDGADAVIMFEHVQTVDEGMIEALRPVGPGENVVLAGEDVRSGETVIRKGRRMRPQDIGACAGLGITEIWVYRKPRVAIISTGDEILPAEAPPERGRVRDINSYVLAGLATECGCVAMRKGIFRDEYETIRSIVESSLSDSDAVILSGGTSVGVKDMIARIIDDLGNPGLLFHGVSLKPGKPMLGGVVSGIPLFGLPGHPAAVSVCFGIFIKPVLAVISGLHERFPQESSRRLRARLAKNVASSPGREDHVRVTLEERDDGFWAVPVLGKSGLIATLVKADGTIVIPRIASGMSEGDLVEVTLF